MTTGRGLGLLLGLVFGTALLLMLVPALAVGAYGLSLRWDRSLWPEGFTLDWIAQSLGDARVQAALAHTLYLSFLAALLGWVLGAAACLSAHLRAPALSRILDAAALLPYTIPPVVVALGALEWFVGRWGAWLPLSALYVGLLAATVFPLVHKTLSGALLQLEAATLLDASRTLGASDLLLLRRVLLPLLWPALVAALLLAWSTAAMEFVIANLLLSGSLELLQPLINSLRGSNGHQAAALVVLSLGVLTALGVLVHSLRTCQTTLHS